MAAAKPTEESELGQFAQLRDQLYWAVREWLKTDAGAMLPPEPDLIEELGTPSYEEVNGKIKVTEKKDLRVLLGRSINYFDALALTFYEGDKTFAAYTRFNYLTGPVKSPYDNEELLNL